VNRGCRDMAGVNGSLLGGAEVSDEGDGREMKAEGGNNWKEEK
jgi:hypothetical protein